MKHVEFFKSQAENLVRDYKTQFKDESGLYQYKPRFFDVDEIVLAFDIDEDVPLGTMRAQHIISQLAGFKKWDELINASQATQELGKLLYENRHETDGIETNIVPNVIAEDWIMYLKQNNLEDTDDEFKLDLFKRVFQRVDEAKIPHKTSKLKEGDELFEHSFAGGKKQPAIKLKVQKDSKGEYTIGQRGQKQYMDIKNHDMLSIAEQSKTYHVLGVGAIPGPHVTIKEAMGNAVNYRLPDDYQSWAMDCVGKAHSGFNSFPCNVEFGKEKTGYYAKIVREQNGKAKRINLSGSIGEMQLAHGYELDPEEKYVIRMKDEISQQGAMMETMMIMGPPPAMQDYFRWCTRNGFNPDAPNPTNKVVAPYYGVKPLWKTRLSQGIVIKAEEDDDYYIVVECSRENTGYKYAKIIVTLGGCA